MNVRSRTRAGDDSLAIVNGLLPAEFLQSHGDPPRDGFRRGDIAIQNGQIESVGVLELSRAVHRLDASDCTVLPGFVDLHVHGAVGHDTMDANVEALHAMALFYASHGVTSFLPTTMTAPRSDTLEAVKVVKRFSLEQTGGARCLGVHLEGPFISPQFPGAQSPAHIRPADPVELGELLAAGPVHMITLAPEQPGARAVVELALAHAVTVVAGHTDASYEEFEVAVGWGVCQATHTYNAMRGLHHREPGALGATLTDDTVFAQLIADNVHVHPAAMKLLWRCKGAARTLLVSDAMRATGLAPGDYELGGQPVTVRDGQCCLPDGTLAGSVLTLDVALVNFLAATGAGLAELWPVTSRTPAASIGLSDRLGEIRPGYWADLVLLDRELQVVATVVQGDIVYLRESSRLTSG